MKSVCVFYNLPSLLIWFSNFNCTAKKNISLFNILFNKIHSYKVNENDELVENMDRQNEMLSDKLI